MRMLLSLSNVRQFAINASKTRMSLLNPKRRRESLGPGTCVTHREERGTREERETRERRVKEREREREERNIKTERERKRDAQFTRRTRFRHVYRLLLLRLLLFMLEIAQVLSKDFLLVLIDLFPFLKKGLCALPCSSKVCGSIINR